MRTYLVTGGAGFIGANFISYLFEKYNQDIYVVNADCLTYAGNLENLKTVDQRKNYVFEKIDIRNKDAVKQLFQKYSFDRIIHFAAETHVDRSIPNPAEFVETNVLGTMHLLNEAKNAWQDEQGFQDNKKFLQVSTDEVYGALGEEGFFYETTPLAPNSPYSASKASAELLVQSYIKTYGFPANVTRCSNNYGPFQFPEKLIPMMINNILLGRKLPVYGDGKNVRDWLYVMDHAKALDLVAEKGNIGEIYNIGGHNEKRNIDLIRIIIQNVREMLPGDDPRRSYITEDLITYVEDRKGHDWRYAIAPEKIKKELGWEPETCFEQGIRMTIKWYLDNEQWLEHVTSGAYQQYYEATYKQ